MLKKIFVTLLLATLSIGSLMSQTTLSSKEMVAITPVVCNALDLDANTKRILNMKMMQIITTNGFGSTSYRYALVPNIVILDKQIAPTVPAMYSIEFELSIYVVDITEGVIVEESSLLLKGVDRVEGRAYASALSQLNPRSPQMKIFMDNARTSILDYYTTRTTTLLKKAETLAEMERYEEAMTVLSPIPESVDEYPQVAEAIVAIYKKKLDKEAKIALQRVEILRSKEKFDEALDELATIDPASNYWDDANAQINKTIEAIERKRVAALEAEKLQLEAQIARAKELTAQKELELKLEEVKMVERAREIEANKSSLEKFTESVNDWFKSAFMS